MRDYKKQLSWLLVAVIVMTAMVPAAPAYAFSLQDLMGQTSGSGGQSFVGLIGVLMDNLFGKLANMIPGVPNNNGGEVVTPKQGKEIVGFYAEWWGKDTSSFNS
ncbi:MAG TPA: glycoside hydrolase family 18, partial [Sporomusaceae bacterium]|nr:glycoside hydrolase family 18 [Sporomusaceae bacterium]